MFSGGNQTSTSPPIWGSFATRKGTTNTNNNTTSTSNSTEPDEMFFMDDDLEGLNSLNQVRQQYSNGGISTNSGGRQSPAPWFRPVPQQETQSFSISPKDLHTYWPFEHTNNTTGNNQQTTNHFSSSAPSSLMNASGGLAMSPQYPHQTSMHIRSSSGGGGVSHSYNNNYDYDGPEEASPPTASSQQIMQQQMAFLQQQQQQIFNQQMMQQQMYYNNPQPQQPQPQQQQQQIFNQQMMQQQILQQQHQQPHPQQHFYTAPQFEMEMEAGSEDDGEDSVSESRMDTDDDAGEATGEISESELNDVRIGDVPISQIVLPPSKTPCLDALAFCVVTHLGAEQSDADREQGEVTINDCDKLLSYIKLFCPKQNQTNNAEARIKALKRWFDGIPPKKRRHEIFKIRIKSDKRASVRKIIKKMENFLSNTEQDQQDEQQQLQQNPPVEVQ